MDHSSEICRSSMRWYSQWIEEQSKTISASTISVAVNCDSRSEGSESGLSPELKSVFFEVARCARSSECPSIDSIIDCLIAQGTIKKLGEEERLTARGLVFAVLGWQTMLYIPALGTCPPQQLAVADEQEGYHGQAFLALKQSHTAAKKPFYEFLMGFGFLLPPSNFSVTVQLEGKSASDDLTNIEPSSFNAFLLDSIGHFKIRWIDVLSCHLEFDERTKTLFLFRYPSFCYACSIKEASEKKTGSVIHAAASPPSSSGRWAAREDVTQMLEEILLSYRLLFGQNKRARRFYRTVDPFMGVAADCKDHLLSILCERKSCSTAGVRGDKDTYSLQEDFPVLKSRIARLHKALAISKPSSWRQLWGDKRDSAGWFTFWAVILFGGVGILLSFIQVLLQIIQIAISR